MEMAASSGPPSGLVGFLQEVAAERRTQGRQSLFPYVELPESKRYDWKKDDGRIAYTKEGIRYITPKSGEGQEIPVKDVRNMARRLDFVYTGHKANRPGTFNDWGGVSR
mmetsp:Transcript_9199/g.21829  ORF Transcript_9199/g.21829 Transcript_9199/m.21829 type:complete len:109 (+) Transcript_9199:41-367(+)